MIPIVNLPLLILHLGEQIFHLLEGEIDAYQKLQAKLQILVLAGCNATDEVANVGRLLSVEAFENEPLLVMEADIDLVGKDAG